MGKLVVRRILFVYRHWVTQVRNTATGTSYCYCCNKPYHLICFKQWSTCMVLEIITSALNLKKKHPNMHCDKIDLLRNVKVMILQEVNEPFLQTAVSKAVTFLGAEEVNVIDHLLWNQNYNACIFSTMADVVFACTATHACIQRFADMSSIPVLCMRSRTHATLQSLATVMAIYEAYGTLRSLNVAWVGPPHPILNSYLLLCPMLGANITFKCCCPECPVHPLLFKASVELTEHTNTVSMECSRTRDVLTNACIIISGPTPKKDKIKEFEIKAIDISCCSCPEWIYFHTCPRGDEVCDDLFYHKNAFTFMAFDNLKYIAAALMAKAVRGHIF